MLPPYLASISCSSERYFDTGRWRVSYSAIMTPFSTVFNNNRGDRLRPLCSLQSRGVLVCFYKIKKSKQKALCFDIFICSVFFFVFVYVFDLI